MPNKIVVVGCGAIGSMAAAFLSKAGHEVSVVDSAQEVRDALSDGDIEVSGALECRSRAVKAVGTLAEAGAGEAGLILVSVKTTAMAKVAPLLEPFSSGRARVVSVQNGIDTEETLAAHFPRERVFRMVVNFAGGLLGPGRVKATFFHPPNFVGGLVPESSGAAAEIAALLTGAGLATEASDGIKTPAWRKAILNSCLMPVSVLTRLTMKALMELPETRRLVEAQIRDFLAVAAAEGHRYEDDFMEKALHYLSNAGDHKPSMLVDFEAGRPLEIDYLNGKIQEYADKHGIACPTNRVILDLLKGALLK